MLRMVANDLSASNRPMVGENSVKNLPSKKRKSEGVAMNQNSKQKNKSVEKVTEIDEPSEKLI